MNITNAVILNGVSPRAQAGAKRSEESLTVTRAEAVWWDARAITPTASARFSQRFFAAFRSQSLPELRSE